MKYEILITVVAAVCVPFLTQTSQPATVPSTAEALASFRRKEAALDGNFQRENWKEDVPDGDAELKTMSVVINAHNEQAYIVRTLLGVLQTCDSELLEIIVVDDGSEPPLLPLLQENEQLNQHLVHGKEVRSPLIHVVRHSEQEGLIRAKIHGASLASGDLVVFLDAHVKPFADWTTPMFRHMNANYKRVVAPVIPVLLEDWTVSRTSAFGFKMMFDWGMNFDWFDDAMRTKLISPDATLDPVPLLSGGLFGISRRWWFESGEYDPAMLMYGAENIEQSLRVWLCGGEITVARDSRVAHLFRAKFPYTVDDYKVMINKARTVKVWFNDPQAHPNETGDDSVNLSEWQERVMRGDPNIRGFMRLTGDVSGRMALRKQCHDFQWYVERFRHVFQERGLLERHSRLFQQGHLCLYLKSGSSQASFTPCDPHDPMQNVHIETQNRIRVKSLCLDANAAEPHKLGKPVFWFPCDFAANTNQNWRLVDGKLKNAQYCATEVNAELVMTSCLSAKAFALL